MIKVLLADDQAMVRGAMAALLSLEGDLEVVAEVARGDEVAAAVGEHAPDVAVLDIEMPGLDGIEVARLLGESGTQTKSLIVTTFGRTGYLKRALAAGASGFILKDSPAEELAEAIRVVHAGGQVVDQGLAAESLFAGDNPLTARECDVLRVALEGLPISQIAQRVYLSEGTVRNYLSSAIQKTATSTRAEAARVARDRGWI